MIIHTTYDYKKTLNSALQVLLQIVGLGAIGYITSTPDLVYLMPVTEIIRSFLKHRKN